MIDAQHSPGTRILIIADDGGVSEALEDSLRTSVYPSHCLTCASDEAVREAESYKPGLLVVDLSTDGKLDCIELAETIRQNRPVPVVFVIDDLDGETLGRALDADPLGFISKPLRPASVQGPLALCMKRVEQARKAQRCAERIRASMDTILRVGMSGFAEEGLYRGPNGAGGSNDESESGRSEESSKIKHLETILDRIAMTLASADDSSTPQAAAALPWTRLPSLTAREREVLRWLVAGHRVSTIATKLNVAPSTIRNHLKSIFRKLEVRSQTELLELLNGMR